MRAVFDHYDSDTDVARAYGHSRSNVVWWRREHGLLRSAGPVVSDAAARLRDDPDAMRQALAEHGSDAAVADAVGVSQTAVSGWRRAHGIDPGGR